MAVNITNDQREFALFDLEQAGDFAIGNPSAISAEFAEIVGDTFEAGDLEALLSELVLGGGVEGVEVGAIDNDSLTLHLTNEGGVSDEVALDRVAAISAVAQDGVDLANDAPEFALFDASTTTSFAIEAPEAVSEELATLVGDGFDAEDAGPLLSEILLGDGVEGVTLNTLDDDSLTLAFTNAAGVTDLVAWDNVAPIADLAAGSVDVADDQNEFAVFSVSSDDEIEVGDVSAVSEELAEIAGEDGLDGGDLEALFGKILSGDGVEGVEHITVDNDSVTLALSNGSATDTIVLDGVADAIAAVASADDDDNGTEGDDTDGDDDAPGVDVGNDQAEFGLFDLERTAIAIGDPAAVSAEFAAIVGETFGQGEGENDLLPLLDELLYGDGVDGVDLAAIDNDSVSLALTGAGGTTDTVAIDNVAVVESLALGFVNLGNGRREFTLVDLDDADAVVIGDAASVSVEFAEIVGDEFTFGAGDLDLARLLDELLLGDGVEGVALNTLDDDSVTLEMTDDEGATDVVAFDNVGAIAELAGPFVDVGNDRAQFAIYEPSEGDRLFVGDPAAVGSDGAFAGIVGDSFEADDLQAVFAEVLAGGGIDGVELVTVDDDSVTLALSSGDGPADTLVFDGVQETLAAISEGDGPDDGDAAGAKNVILMVSDGAGFNGWLAADYYQGLAGEQSYQVTRPDGTEPVVYGMSHWSLNLVDEEGNILPNGTDPAEAAGAVPQGYDPQTRWDAFENAFENDFPPVDLDYTSYTDSAAAGTTMHTGIKTANGRLNVDWAGEESFETIAEMVMEEGRAAGAVSSVMAAHATPASVIAHNVDRGEYVEIFNEMIASDLDVIMGGGHPLYDSSGNALDPAELEEDDYRYVGGEETFADIAEDGVVDGFVFIDAREDFEALAEGEDLPEKVLGIARTGTTLQASRERLDDADTPSGMAFNEDVPSLATMTVGALEVLDQDEDGFYLMSEGGAVDWMGHANAMERYVEEQVAFNEAVDAVIEWVEENSSWDETLLVVTSDHETGGIWGEGTYVNSEGGPVAEDRSDEAIEAARFDPAEDEFIEFLPVQDRGEGELPGHQFASGNHTNELVPLWAIGAGAEMFEEYDRTDLEAAELWGDQYDWDGAYIDNTALFEVMSRTFAEDETASALAL